MSNEPPFVCDHCRQPIHRDANGYWVGDDETSDCRSNRLGHEVEGREH